MPSLLRRLYRRLRYGPALVVVSGLPRSGTSMLMKMLARRGETDDIPPERMRESFADDLWRARYQLTHRPWFEMLEVHYGDVLSRPLEGARQINDFLGGHLDTEAMAGVVDPNLYRNRAQKRE